MWLFLLCNVFFALVFNADGLNPFTVHENENLFQDNGFSESFLRNYGKEGAAKDRFEALTPLYLPHLDKEALSEKCYNDVNRIHNVFSNPPLLLRNQWVLKLFDSWGKFEDGIIQGNNRLLGFFEECISIDSPPGVRGDEVKGQYCLMKYKRKRNATDERMAQILIPADLQFLIGSYSTCMPLSCTSQELIDSVNNALETADLYISSADCQTNERRELDGAQIFGICFFSMLLLILLIASLFDLISAKLSKNRLRKRLEVLLAFSIPQNFAKIITLDTNPPPHLITCIHGLRLLSICWVVWCHEYVYSVLRASNKYGLTRMSQQFMMQVVANGDKAVDTFFTISGFLVTYNMFKELKKNPKFPVKTYYLHRFVRLTPAIAITCAFFATVAELFVNGPFVFDYAEYETAGCRRSWWVDVCYVANIMFRIQPNIPEKVGQVQSCIPQSWYTAADTQMYIFLPIILIPLFFRGRKGLAWLYFWILVSVLIPAVLIGTLDLYPMMMVPGNLQRNNEYVLKIYSMPYCRASPYLVGTLSGYILHKYPKGEVKLKKLAVAIGWASMSIVAFVILFGMYPFNQFAEFGEEIPADQMSVAVSVIYGSLHRGLWGVWIAWIILACHWGYGGVVNRFLSYPALQPISRLTYCIFLTSLGIQSIAQYSIKRAPYFTNFTKFEETCGILAITILASFLLNFIAESPILRIEKIVQTNGDKKKKNVQNGIENKIYIEKEEKDKSVAEEM